MLWTRQVIYNIKVYIRLAKLNLQNVSSQYKVMLPSPGRKDSQDWRLLPFLWLWKDNHNRYPCVGTVLDNKYNLKPAFRIRIRIHRDPLNLAGSGSTSIPAPDPDPDPLRFLSSDPDPLKKALIWIWVTPKLFRVKSKTKCFCYLRNAFSKFWR